MKYAFDEGCSDYLKICTERRHFRRKSFEVCEGFSMFWWNFSGSLAFITSMQFCGCLVPVNSINTGTITPGKSR